MHSQLSVNTRPHSQDSPIDELFAQHYKYSFRTAHRILRSKEDAEDAVQTAYCAAFEHISDFRGEASFKTWLTRIVLNCCMRTLRHRRDRSESPLDDLKAVIASPAATPEVLCYWSELEAVHAKAVARLPKLLQEVYSQAAASPDVAFSDLSARLCLTKPAAKSRLFRARRRVERTLQGIQQRRAA